MINQLKNKIRNTLVVILKDCGFVLSIYNIFYRLKSRKKFLSQIDFRAKLSIYDYFELSQELPFYPMERVKDSNFYGHAYSLKQYAGVPNIPFAIEHGLYYDSYIPHASYLKTTKQIITYSLRRKQLLQEELDKCVLDIGPYIHYAISLLNEQEITNVKKEIGRVLLFFPSHSCVDDISRFDINNIISKVCVFAKEHNFDTVLVNMYYYDVLYTDYASHYINAGFKVVTAGNRLDLNFLSRLKSIILLSDYTISNNVGTHIGYCIYLHKPHYILDKSLIDITDSNQFKEIASHFLYYNQEITKHQFDVVSKYWGIDSIRSKSDLKLLLNNY